MCVSHYSLQFIGAAISTLDPVFVTHETPIAARFANYYSAAWWNCVAVLSDSYKDTLTKDLPNIKSPNSANYNTADRATCMTQAGASLNDLFFGGNDAYLGALASVGAGLGSPPASSPEATMNTDVSACGTDATCLEDLAIASDYSPTILGHIVAQQIFQYAQADGFNQLGTDDGCTVSCRPYKDTTGYSPVNRIITRNEKPPNVVGSQRRPGRWIPLTETDGKGFFYDQDHVTPHIGQKAKFRFLPESERTSRVVRLPSYSKSRKAEADAVIAQMSLLDDFKKIEIEAFDDKLYVGNAIVGAFIGKALSPGFVDPELGQPSLVLTLERLVHFVHGYTAAEYDSIVISWKEKVANDLIRPTSIIKLYGDRMITTWAPGGIQTFAAKDFEAYIRVMPHSEYTSGSSCLFEAIKDYIIDYLSIAMELADTTFPVQFPAVEIGASKVEPGIVPSSPVVLSYGSIEEMAEAGNLSRFNGGMHFFDSVPAGVELCDGIGNIVAAGVIDLI